MRQMLVFALGLSALLASPAEAVQSRCHDREKIVDHLASKYGEQQRVIGPTKNGYLMEIWASPKTGTWTMLRTDPEGTTCIITAGRHFDVIKPVTGRES